MTNPYAPQQPPAPYVDPNAQAAYAPQQPPAQYIAPYAPQQPQGYAPQPSPYGPPAGYGQPMPYQQPMAPQAPPVDISQYLDNGLKAQGKFWSWKGLSFGAFHTGQVARDLTVSDIRQAEYQGQRLNNFDGSPKLSIVVPIIMADGTEAQWDVKQGEFGQLATALNAAGVTQNLSTPRELIGGLNAADFVKVTYTHDRKNQNGSTTKCTKFEITKANGMPLPVAATAPVAQAPQAPVQAPVQHQAPQLSAPVQAPVQAPMYQAPAPAASAQPAAPADQAAFLAALSPEDQAKIKAMLGQAG